MDRKQLAALFTINLGLNAMGVVVASLMPLDAARLGADSVLIGIYMSSTALAIGIGTMLAGWLSDRLQRRKLLLILAGLIEIIGLWQVGWAANMVELYVETLLVAVFFGIQGATINIVAGLFAAPEERGRVFGLISSASAFGALIGGLAGGPIVSAWGYSGFFTAGALVTMIQPLAALLLHDMPLEPASHKNTPTATRNPLMNRTFLLLFLASVLIFIASSVQGMGRSLLMDKLGFSASDITSTVAVSGLLTLPFPLALGWLSDRVGRRSLLIISYLTGALSLMILAGSFVLWHFWISTAFTVGFGATLAVGSALVTDLVPQDSLGAGLSLFAVTFQIGQVIGFAATGVAIQALGITPALISAAFLPVIGIGLLIPIRKAATEYSVRAPQSIAQSEL